ncbi:hypothetical protein PRIPAC_79793 [Pristionchus pacificus]|nr:hypothetical protein PRIPAC_79793 [Pristionchus pacificus]
MDDIEPCTISKLDFPVYYYSSVSRIPNIDLNEHKRIRTNIKSGGLGNNHQYYLPGNLLGFNSDFVVVAVRKFEISVSSKQASTDALDEQEILNLYKLHHPNIVQMLGNGTLDSDRYLIFEYCHRTLAGAIDEGLTSNDFITSSDFIRWAREIAGGLNYLHVNDFSHGNLSPISILLDYHSVAKLTDFGITARIKPDEIDVSCTKTIYWHKAPEQIDCENLDSERLKNSDIWSFGIVMWEMITCRIPFEGIEDSSFSGVMDRKKLSPCLPTESPFNCLVNLLNKCWNEDTAHRPTIFLVSSDHLPQITKEFEEEFYNGVVWRDECLNWVSTSNTFESFVPHR